MNYIRTASLMAALVALFVGIGFLLGGQMGAVIAFLIAGCMNFYAYWNSDQVVLRMYGAQPVDAASAPKLVAVVRALSERAGLPMPKVYIMDNAQPNAFATGRSPQHAAVAVTKGLLNRLSGEEVEGVIAHELAHIKNRDTLIMTISATLVGGLVMLLNISLFLRGNRSALGAFGHILLMLLAPLAASVIQMAISRTREYAADKTGAEICGKPWALASALDAISGAGRRIPNPEAEENPATAHLFISSPLSGRSLAGLFSTHPPMSERIRRLNAMTEAYSGPASGYDSGFDADSLAESDSHADSGVNIGVNIGPYSAASRGQTATRQAPASPWATTKTAPIQDTNWADRNRRSTYKGTPTEGKKPKSPWK